MALGINAVHQEVVLCPHLTVAANMFLGDENTRFGLLRKRAMVKATPRRSSTISASTCRPMSLLGDLTIGQQQLVADRPRRRCAARSS